ncbi:MAG TPA: hypothetical protein VF637_11270 [Sphingomicrobium sp.]|jgi:hypothetical protein
MKRSALYWLVAGLAFWGWMFASNFRQATAAFMFSTIVGVVVTIALLGFQIIRARRGR